MRWSAAGFLIVFLAAQLAPLPNAITVMVIKSGTAVQQALRDARLELIGGPDGTRVARTDVNGTFVFSNLASGDYRLLVTCDGFIRQTFPHKIVFGREQQTANVLFELEPAPTATGWILDTYGEPIPNVMVEALRRSYDVRGNPKLSRAATALTDDRGEYRIFWLDPGDYFFYATSPMPDGTDGQPVVGVVPTYSPGVSAPEDARSLRLDIGREVRVDFRLQRADSWKVSGNTMNGATGRSIVATITLTPPAQNPSFSKYRAQSSATVPFLGEFAMLHVVPGSYILAARSGSGNQEITAFQRIVIRPLLFAPLEGYYLASLTLNPPLSIEGRLFVESREPVDLRQANVSLLSVDSDLPSPRVVLARPDGQFSLKGVVRGTYVLETTNLPEDLYLKAARYGDDDILEKPLALEKEKATGPLQVLLGSDGGHIQVAAFNEKNELHAGAHFVLVPDAARRSRREQYRIALSGDDGQAVLRGIPPGSYKLFAWEDLEANAYLNSDYLRIYEAAGVPVTISRGNNPPLAVRLIPKN